MSLSDRIGNHVPCRSINGRSQEIGQRIIKALAVAYAKHAISVGMQCDLDSAMAIRRICSNSCATEDKSEGMGAFIEKETHLEEQIKYFVNNAGKAFSR